MKLAEKNCISCQDKESSLSSIEIKNLLKELNSWQITNDQKWLFKKYKFNDFKKTLDFVNQVSKISEEQNHHPNINFTYGECEIKIQTHKINALVENDFILASKIDNIEKNFGFSVNFSKKF